MIIYKFGFGYNTPSQIMSNRLNGWDDEESVELYIEAKDEAAAKLLGKELAEKFMIQLFQNFPWDEAVPSWEAMKFASWVEVADDEGIPAGCIYLGAKMDIQQRVVEMIDWLGF